MPTIIDDAGKGAGRDAGPGRASVVSGGHPEAGALPRTVDERIVPTAPCNAEDCRLYLARITGPMSVEIVDGCHANTSDVAKAAKIYKDLFSDEGPWAMVEVRPMPGDPPIPGPRP